MGGWIHSSMEGGRQRQVIKEMDGEVGRQAGRGSGFESQLSL